MLGTYNHRFQLPNGHEVFVPSTFSRDAAALILDELKGKWRPPNYFYHLRAGGHVAALRVHLHNEIFSTLDIAGFFDSITRSKIYRALRAVGLGYTRAWEIAQQSTVEKTRRARNFSLPYGFPQSPALASVALDRSALGRTMQLVARSNHARFSCYVDDLVISGTDENEVESARISLVEAANKSNFSINMMKSQRPDMMVTAFNVVLRRGLMTIADSRMLEFEAYIIQAVPAAVSALIAYARSVNSAQAERLIEVASTSADENVRKAAILAQMGRQGSRPRRG